MAMLYFLCCSNDSQTFENIQAYMSMRQNNYIMKRIPKFEHQEKILTSVRPENPGHPSDPELIIQCHVYIYICIVYTNWNVNRF